MVQAIACPDETAVLDFIEGRFTAVARAAFLQHVDGCAACMDVLSAVVKTTSGQPDAPPRGACSEWLPPAQIDEYQVGAPLGRGAVGQVFRGIDTRLARAVAIKFLAHDPGPQARDRFEREARAVARLSHPNVVAVYRVGEVDGRPYLVSELVDGRSLDCLPTPLPWREVLSIGLQVARGLRAAHAAGVLHRDIKPANIVRADDGSVKLLDFGLAKVLEEGEPGSDGRAHPAALRSLSLTATGALVGTPLYMPPEAWRGAPTDARADVFSLGAVLYELCSGRPPLRADARSAPAGGSA